MRKFILLSLLALCTNVFADNPWKFQAYCKEAEIFLNLDLYNESVDVPGMEMFGPMNGFMNGRGLYCTWMITSFDIKNDKEASIRLSNDLGSETQQINITCVGDSSYQLNLENGVCMKKVVGKKLQKLNSSYIFKKR